MVTTVTVLDSAGSTQTVNTLPALGQSNKAGSIPVTLASDQAQTTATDRSGTIAAGGTAQQLMAANSSRQGFWVQNQSSGDLYIYGLGTATAGQPSMKIGPDQLYETPLTHVGVAAISIIGATTGQAFAAREW